ncbi:AbrB family transcriptional regulator [Mycolicibacterium stellerae]|uniref:AbrB family transcriptional regulator n=1 Tax=Mycolicibacterium stellerae TaxID=2358193 RepID=UPI0013DD8995|nr:AbrB family transcriptional regulator [Mycolicibacterium stellerae]
MTTRFVARYGRWVFAAATVAALGVVFTAVKLPAGWLIAGMVGAAVTAILFRRQLNPPAKAMAAAQGVIGVVAVEPLTKLTGSDLMHFAGCAAFSISITLGLSVVFGILLARFAPYLGVATANLSLIAGGASTISSMARELGADERYVALSQYLRLTIVVLTMPIVLSHLGDSDPTPRLVGAHDHWHVSGLLALAALVFAGGKLAKRVRMPAPYLLGPLVVAMVVAIAHPSLDLLMNPATVVTNVAYVVIGWQAGGGFAVDVLRRFVKLIPLTLLFIAMTIASCFLVAVAVSHWAGVSLADAYLATTPGGIYGVLAIANEVHSGPIVVTLQVLRLVTMVLAAGMIPKIIGWLSRRQGVLTHRGHRTTR